MLQKLIFNLIFIPLSTWAFSVEAENVYRPALLLKKVAPVYPSSQYRNAGGTRMDVGLVDVIFMVGKNGKPYEVSVRRSSSPIFEEEAVRAILQYEYKPAIFGNSVANSMRSAIVTSEFWYGNSTGFQGTMGAPEGFHSFYNRFAKELQKVEPDEYKARRNIEKMTGLRDQTYVTLSHTELARYRYAGKFSTPSKAIDALYALLQFEGIVRHKRTVLEEDIETMVVINLLRLLLENGRSAEVLELYARYHQRISDLPELYSEAIEKTTHLQKSDVLIERKLELTKRGDAHLPMFKRVFTIDQVVGSLSSLKLRCDTKFLKLEFKPDAQYALPEAWGKCDLQLIGEPGTTASVLQQ